MKNWTEEQFENETRGHEAEKAQRCLETWRGDYYSKVKEGGGLKDI